MPSRVGTHLEGVTPDECVFVSGNESVGPYFLHEVYVDCAP